MTINIVYFTVYGKKEEMLIYGVKTTEEIEYEIKKKTYETAYVQYYITVLIDNELLNSLNTHNGFINKVEVDMEEKGYDFDKNSKLKRNNEKI